MMITLPILMPQQEAQGCYKLIDTRWQPVDMSHGIIVPGEITQVFLQNPGHRNRNFEERFT